MFDYSPFCVFQLVASETDSAGLLAWERAAWGERFWETKTNTKTERKTQEKDKNKDKDGLLAWKRAAWCDRSPFERQKRQRQKQQQNKDKNEYGWPWRGGLRWDFFRNQFRKSWRRLQLWLIPRSLVRRRKGFSRCGCPRYLWSRKTPSSEQKWEETMRFSNWNPLKNHAVLWFLSWNAPISTIFLPWSFSWILFMSDLPKFNFDPSLYLTD